MNAGIYAIKNKIDGKMYIGRSVNMERRRYEHLLELRNSKHANNHLQRAFNKYGENNFEFLILEKCDKNICGEKEIEYINKYNTFLKGYNLTSGGDGGQPGAVLSEETKNKLSESRKGAKQSEKHKQFLSQLKKQQWKDKCYRQEMSKAMSKGHLGLKHNNCTKSKMAIGCSKRKLSDPDVMKIRIRYLKGEKQSYILKDYPVTISALSKCCLFQTFKYLPNTIEELEKLIGAE